MVSLPLDRKTPDGKKNFVSSILVIGLGLAIFLFLFGVLLFHARRYMPFLSDDALISLRYAQRLVQGHGLTWTDGPACGGVFEFSVGPFKCIPGFLGHRFGVRVPHFGIYLHGWRHCRFICRLSAPRLERRASGSDGRRLSRTVCSRGDLDDRGARTAVNPFIINLGDNFRF